MKYSQCSYAHLLSLSDNDEVGIIDVKFDKKLSTGSWVTMDEVMFCSVTTCGKYPHDTDIELLCYSQGHTTTEIRVN